MKIEDLGINIEKNEPRTGPADKKLEYIAYEDSYLIKLDEMEYKGRTLGMDDIKNILRDDFK